MTRYMMTLMTALFAWTTMNAMDYETARERAYYLTDKMAYELNLNDQQYNDAYEINLDYLLSINTEADLADARYLAYRNDDLRHILYDWQWTAFAAVDYLFRPLWWLNGGWYFPIYNHYAHGYYFYHRPRIFWDYRGGHGRYFFSGGFYHDRRPVWHGGLRGMNRSMIGHPNPGAGRYGYPGGGRGHETRGGFRPDGYRPGTNGRGGNGYHFDSGNRPGHGGNNNNFRPEGNGRNNGGNNGYRPEGNGRNHEGTGSQSHGGSSNYRPEGNSHNGSSMGHGGSSMSRGSGSSTSRGSSSRTTVGGSQHSMGGSVSRGSSTSRNSSISSGASPSRGSSMSRGSGSSSRGTSPSRGTRGGGRH